MDSAPESLSSNAERSGDGKLYGAFASVYDRIFGAVLADGIRRTVSSLPISAASRVLDVGVGTGLSLEAYPESVEVTGIDTSADMLRQAHRRVEQRGWNHVRLHQMDAMNMDLPSNHFDCVAAFHVASVVPDARQMMREMFRVCKPGGTIVVVGYFRSDKEFLARMIDRLTPVTQKLGWRTDLRTDELIGDLPPCHLDWKRAAPTMLFKTLSVCKPVVTRSSARPTRMSETQTAST